MKIYIILLSILALSQSISIMKDDFILEGIYSISNDCDVNLCQSTQIYAGTQQFEYVCPQAGNGNGLITKSKGYYIFELKTTTAAQTEGHLLQYLTNQNIVENNQIQMDLNQNGYTLNIMPCTEGQSTSYLCPSDSYYNDKALVAWKSYKGNLLEGCNFIMIRE